jgi:tRNA-2-methylthio-N6-dimethylallyladenosine synthase
VLFLARHYFIATMGCQMNEYDSDRAGQLLRSLDFQATEDPKKADLIIINTCTVRAKPEQKAYSLLGRMIALKNRKPRLIVGIMGCMAQQWGSVLLDRFPGLDFVLGTREIGSLPEMLPRLEQGAKLAATDLTRRSTFPAVGTGYFAKKVKSFVTIMEGCNNFCAYCIVPYVRGREVSRPADDILNETRALIAQGVREVTLLGQNVNSFRWDQGHVNGFPSLLRRVNDLDGLLRIRFTTSHPKDLSDELIRCFEELDKLCPHIHLPFQAGSDRVLKAMRRDYSRDHYIGLIEKLRSARPDMAITSDVMVGFPGETEKDFELTLDLIRKVEFDNLYSFKYSDREGTPAAKMDSKISDVEKSCRLDMLQGLQKRISLSKNKSLLGLTVQVLVEGQSKRGQQMTGRTPTNKVVNFSSNPSMLGSIMDVKIRTCSANSLFGEPLF